MFDQHFPSSATWAGVFGPRQAGERVMWRGRCGVAEYAFEMAASMPRWTLPEATDVMVTDRRVLYAYTAEDGHKVRSGELRWLWPQHLRVQPGQVSNDRCAAATQIQLVCGGADGTYPALVFAGGDLATVAEADRLANVIRQAIARFRVDNADRLGLSTGQARLLSRMLIGPEFRNHQGGDGQTVSLLGAMPVSRPAPAAALSAAIPLEQVMARADEAATVAQPLAEETVDFVRATTYAATAEVAWPMTEEVTPSAPGGDARPAAGEERTEQFAGGLMRPVAEGTRLIYRPGLAADATRALMAARAEEAAQQAEPALATRAADLAARVANLISGAIEPEPGQDDVDTWDFNPDAWRSAADSHPSSSDSRPRHSEPRVSEAWYADDLRLTRGEGLGMTRGESLDMMRGEGWVARDDARDSARGKGRRVTRAEQERRADSEPDRIGPGDGRPVARNEERRTAGSDKPPMSRGDELWITLQAQAKISEAERVEVPTTTPDERAEAIRRTAARMASNSARARIATRRADRETGAPIRGNRDN